MNSSVTSTANTAFAPAAKAEAAARILLVSARLNPPALFRAALNQPSRRNTESLSRHQ